MKRKNILDYCVLIAMMLAVGAGVSKLYIAMDINI